MSGFIGARARKRRRNIFIILILIILVAFFFFISSVFKTLDKQIVPNDNILPDPTDDLTSLASKVEELDLIIFQKEQKIKFRDVQIKNLQTELNNTNSKLENIILELNEMKNAYNTLSSNNENSISSNEFKSLQDKFTKLNIENDSNISKIKTLDKKIEDLNNNLISFKVYL